MAETFDKAKIKELIGHVATATTRRQRDFQAPAGATRYVYHVSFTTDAGDQGAFEVPAEEWEDDALKAKYLAYYVSQVIAARHVPEV